ncbi:IclR family transcriptional regulator domain-containing protein [Streptacidiphilus rugosus]|uniref:IclR family transcriptional regulator domain-containing protein n=1 Tax=Streptacidiphilus rugosus TaxID=405783 RepID=UPI00068AE3F2|nr:IclR family transcriptional regulator C-terminal domain-containing protein [Streptacidiphilus rugosus]
MPAIAHAPSADAAAPAEAVGPLTRGLAVLRLLTDAGGRLGLSELVRETGLARSTVDRIASTLERMGYLRVEGSAAALAPRLMELGNAYLSAVRLPDLLGPHATRLADLLDESVSLAVPDGDGIRFVHQATRRRALSLSFRIGDRLPIERTAPGPLFAAEWTEAAWAAWRERRAVDPEDRGFPAVPPRSGAPVSDLSDLADLVDRAAEAAQRGWAADDQLIEPGLVAIALPVRDLVGRQVCAVSVVSHTSRHSAASLAETALPRLRETVALMEAELGRPTPPLTPSAERPAEWSRQSKQELGAEFVESLARGLTVLTAFGEGRAELPLTAVAEATGLPRATARRALLTLQHLGYVAAAERCFAPTPQMLALGFAPLSRLSLAQIAEPHLAALAARVHDSASLAVLAGDDIQYIARVAATRVMSVDLRVGTRLPAYATSMGRVLLAGLPPEQRAARLASADPQPLTRRTVTSAAALAALLDQAADEGHALVDEELEDGLRAIAVPVRDRDGRAVAAVNVSMHAARRSLADCRALLPALRATAAAVETDLHTAGRYARVEPV